MNFIIVFSDKEKRLGHNFNVFSGCKVLGNLQMMYIDNKLIEVKERGDKENFAFETVIMSFIDFVLKRHDNLELTGIYAVGNINVELLNLKRYKNLQK